MRGNGRVKQCRRWFGEPGRRCRGPRFDVFILTLKLDEPSHARLDYMRRQYFPIERNVLSAHLTLFHTLSEAHVQILEAALDGARTDAMPLRFARPRSLGRGVAIEVMSMRLTAFHDYLKKVLGAGLSAQDQQSFRPHVTVQNKVSSSDARRLFDMLCATFEPWTGEGLGVEVWRYLGGPWEFHSRHLFESAEQH